MEFCSIGAASGVTQMVRGVIAAPQAAIAPRQGKWWNENERRWVMTKMEDEAKSIEGVPDDDYDIIGIIEDDLDSKASASLRSGKAKVKEMFYYDILQVSPTADDAIIRRRYYILAKQYHPDRCPDNKAASEKFKSIAEAYEILSDPDLRKLYDKEGREGLSATKVANASEEVSKIDPILLFASLFASDKFNEYIGRLAMATSAAIGDSNRVSISEARLLQKRRLIRLALKLLKKIDPFVTAKREGQDTKDIESKWKAEAMILSYASYGYQLVTTIGKVRKRHGSNACAIALCILHSLLIIIGL